MDSQQHGIQEDATYRVESICGYNVTVLVTKKTTMTQQIPLVAR